MFDRLIHADWSVAPAKRWMAIAERGPAGWTVAAPEPVGATTALLTNAFSAAANGQRVLVGFDFPIGVPAAYGVQTGYKTFRNLLLAAGEGTSTRFFDVAVPRRYLAWPAVLSSGIEKGRYPSRTGGGARCAQLRRPASHLPVMKDGVRSQRLISKTE
jgi:hypothetical protein